MKGYSREARRGDVRRQIRLGGTRQKQEKGQKEGKG